MVSRELLVRGISDELLRLRTERRIGQEVLSILSGVCRQEISRIECRARFPWLDTVGVLAEALGTDAPGFAALCCRRIRELQEMLPAFRHSRELWPRPYG